LNLGWEDAMRVGLQLPQWGDAAGRAGLLAIARAAEAAGFDSLWASDHVVYPLQGAADYPYAPGGPPFKAEDGYLEAITTLGVIAGCTERIRLGTSILVLPMRETLLTAKSLATLDVLSGGRLSLAVAAGWWRAEFEALGAGFDERGARLDQQLEALARLWTHGRDEMHGPHVSYPLVAVEPRPLQAGGPELWLGGAGARTWRRVARSSAAGWHGIGYAAEPIRRARAAIERECLAAGRDPSGVRYSTATGMPGDADRMRQRLSDLERLGVSQVVFIPRDPALAATLECIERFGREVRPHVPSVKVEARS
jgi:probable F420-dependent oxidoreductase